MNLPLALISINAYAGPEQNESSTELADGAEEWTILNAPPKIRPFLSPPAEESLLNWRNERVGWGLILPKHEGLTPTAAARADDAPEPIQQLVAERNAKVYRYDKFDAYGYLWDSMNNFPISVSSASYGNGEGRLPLYLLIYGTPDEIPWQLQFSLNATRAVGRLHLTGTALENYVSACLNDWKSFEKRSSRTLVWATDHDPHDISSLMRRTIADPIHESYASDSDISSATALFGNAATAANLWTTLAHLQPGVVVTTSHGCTLPLDDPVAMARSIGFLVDQNRTVIRPSDLLDGWQPEGAIWYAHACCSAGSDNTSVFSGLVADDTPIGRILKAIPAAGSLVAPLPTALLSAPRPLKCFIGHVEPTFNFTLEDTRSGQAFTQPLRKAMYNRIFSGVPIGLAFRDFYAQLSGFYTQYDIGLLQYNRGADTTSTMLADLLIARDIRTMVLLGDPAATLPPTSP
jgi:hypothetical protein